MIPWFECFRTNSIGIQQWCKIFHVKNILKYIVAEKVKNKAMRITDRRLCYHQKYRYNQQNRNAQDHKQLNGTRRRPSVVSFLSPSSSHSSFSHAHNAITNNDTPNKTIKMMVMANKVFRNTITMPVYTKIHAAIVTCGSDSKQASANEKRDIAMYRTIDYHGHAPPNRVKSFGEVKMFRTWRRLTQRTHTYKCYSVFYFFFLWVEIEIFFCI